MELYVRDYKQMSYVDALGVLAPELGCFGRFPAKSHKQMSYTQSLVIKELSWQVSPLRRSLPLGCARPARFRNTAAGVEGPTEIGRRK
jgi:hypothetical protein